MQEFNQRGQMVLLVVFPDQEIQESSWERLTLGTLQLSMVRDSVALLQCTSWTATLGMGHE